MVESMVFIILIRFSPSMEYKAQHIAKQNRSNFSQLKRRGEGGREEREGGREGGKREREREREAGRLGREIKILSTGFSLGFLAVEGLI